LKDSCFKLNSKASVTKIAIERAIVENSGIIGKGYERKRYSA